ncbi:hypothetical protein [Streptomyces sp. NRRL S-475]|uniref:hypothetical protein n=1 Tax=Streptomyces sp. NRRL S-475 TaxID=1463910 RepID=UPI00131D9150|nr:hypothetical protein [Streptomyces sp. NRRL S-475]
MSSFNTIWPVASFILGATLTQLNSSLSERRQKARDREAREYEASKSLLEGKKNFEIQILSDLYDMLTALNEAADKLARWHKGDEENREPDTAKELCSKLQSDHAAAWRLNELLFDADLNRFVSDAIGVELFPHGPNVIPSKNALEGYGDRVWDAHAAVAVKLKELYAPE